ncbi:hypothetical protein Tco_1347137 [Tanacetum coccineum]
MIAGTEDRHHGPSDAEHNPSQPFEFNSKETCGSQLQPSITKTKVHKSSLEPREINNKNLIRTQRQIQLLNNIKFTSCKKESYALSLRSCQNIRVTLFSIHIDDGNPSSVNIKQHCGRSLQNRRPVYHHSQHDICVGHNFALASSEANDNAFKGKNDVVSRLGRAICNILKELRDTPFSGTDEEDAKEHVEKVSEISKMFNLLSVSKDHIMLTIFLNTLIEAARRSIKSEPSGTITSWDITSNQFLPKYYPPFKTVRQIEGLHNFKQEVDETLYRTWERFKGLLFKCLQHDLNGMQQVLVFYKGLDVPTRHMLGSQGPIPNITPINAKKPIQDMVDHSREVSKVNKRVHEVQVGCDICQGYYLSSGYKQRALGYYSHNDNMPSGGDQRASLEESVKNFMNESTKRHAAADEMLMKYDAKTKATMKNHATSTKNLGNQIDQHTRAVKARLDEASISRTSLKSYGKKKSHTQDLLVVKMYVEPYVSLLPFLERKIMDDEECR